MNYYDGLHRGQMMVLLFLLVACKQSDCFPNLRYVLLVDLLLCCSHLFQVPAGCQYYVKIDCCVLEGLGARVRTKGVFRCLLSSFLLVVQCSSLLVISGKYDQLIQCVIGDRHVQHSSLAILIRYACILQLPYGCMHTCSIVSKDTPRSYLNEIMLFA